MLKLEKTGGSSTYNSMRFFVDPTTALEPGSDGNSVIDTGLDLTAAAHLGIRKAFIDPGDTYHWDELRVGLTWNAVVPTVNDPPVANDDSPTVAEDGPAITFNPADNDNDPEGSPIFVTSTDTTGLQGTLNVSATSTTLSPVADSFIQQTSATTNFGSSTTLRVKAESGSNRRKSYLRFDLSGLGFDHTAGLLAATLTLNFVDSGLGDDPTIGNWDFEVYGLNDGDAGEAWGEGAITWNNAPANDTGSNDFLPGQTTLLGSFTQIGRIGTIEFEPAALANFVAGSTLDDNVSFLIKRTTLGAGGDSYVHTISAKESANGATLELTPNTNLTYDPNGQFASLNAGQTATDSFTYVLSDGVQTSVGTVVVTVYGSDDDLSYTSGGGADDNLTLRINGLNTELVPSGGGAAVATQLTSITSAIIIHGSAGDNTLTLDYSNGNPIPAGGVSFTGGAEVGGDSLVITGTASPFTSVTYRADSLDSGLITMAGGPGAGSIAYSGLEPIIDNGDAVNRIFTLNTVSASITLTAVSATQSNIAGSFENVTFNNPTGSLTINGNAGDEIFDITSISSGLSVPVQLNGLAGDDIFNFNIADVNPANFSVDGGAHTPTGDSLNFDGQGQVAIDSGSDIASPTFNTVNYVNIETPNLSNAVTAVPTLGEWGIILLSILLLTMGLHHLLLIPAPMLANSAVANSALPRTANGWVYSDCEFRKSLKALGLVAAIGYACSLLFTGTITTADTIGGLLTVPVAAYFAHMIVLLRKQ